VTIEPIGQTGQIEFPLDWVDGFVLDIKPHVFLREADDLLIILPNQSYRLNPAGKKILSRLLDGENLTEIIGCTEPPPKIREDLFRFFCGIAAMVKGCLGEGRGRPEVESIPYRRPYHKFPILSEIAITYRCNLSCKFCYASVNRSSSGTELGVDDLALILTKIKGDAQVPSVSFTGGEPTLRPDLPLLIKAASDNGLRVNLISNGILITPEKAVEYRDAGLASAQISLEGPDAQTHDDLTGVSGSFASTLNGLKALREAGIPVHTNTTLNSGNLMQATRMPRLVKELGLTRFSMNMIIPSPWLKEHYPDLLIRYDRIGDIVLRIRDEARAVGVRFMWYSPTPYCLFNPIAHNLGNKGCAACDGLLSVDPLGRIIPCSSFFEPQGSLLESNFPELWHSASSASIREKSRAPSKCRDCDLFDLCEGACPLYWATMGTGELFSSSCEKSPRVLSTDNPRERI